MVFSSLVFLEIYLPVVLAVYYLCPKKFRNLFLFIVNLLFYGWGEPVYISLMLFSTVVDYVHGRFIGKYREKNPKKARRFVASSVIINLALLIVFKYAGFIGNTLNIVVPFLNIPVLSLPLPIGISFYTFQTMSYSIDVYRGQADVQKNIISFGTYVSLFPQLIAGPIVRYKDVATQLDSRRETLSMFSNGVRLFTLGLLKKVLIANEMGALWNSLRSYSDNGAVGAWVGAVAFSLQIYFDFSGYSDMARGLGNMFGFSFLKNFDYPYISSSISEFWRRWHISLGTWFREYVYIPLGGNRKGMLRFIVNLIIVWFLTGLWHGACVNYIVWGLYFGFFIILERLFLSKLLAKLPKVVGHLYTLFFVVISMVIFFFADEYGGLSGAISHIGEMFSFGEGMGNNTYTCVVSYLPLLIFSILAATPVFRKLWVFLRSKWKPFFVLEGVGTFAVLALCVASLVSESYNPFLYFRF